MNQNFLFPHSYKKPALIVLIICILFSIYLSVFGSEPDFLNFNIGEKMRGDELKVITRNFAFTIDGILLIISSIVYGFSKEKVEDEYIQKIRLESLVWAVYINYALVIITFLILYDISFLYVMVYNLFTVLIIFNIKFYISKTKLNKSLSDEE
ncbi:MAG: hypothetical protein B6I18_06365 [Bacteroidetes bacterium 4572_112]|nr:MAG: hypothetical protein B6I18_06365 [Bacteroidetes bacterium 4572_112]